LTGTTVDGLLLFSFSLFLAPLVGMLVGLGAIVGFGASFGLPSLIHFYKRHIKKS